MLPAALLLLSTVSALRICGRSHYSIDSDAIFQRIELPSAEKCVERCIENINYCRAVEYLEIKKRKLGFCIVHTVNSETDKNLIHPDPKVDPKSTIYELLERCPPHSTTDIQKKITQAHRSLLAEGRGGFDETTRADAFFPEHDRLSADEGSYGKKEHYAVMKSLDSGDDPRNPFDSPDEKPKRPTVQRSEYISGRASLDGLVPIRPAQVTHFGQPIPLASPQISSQLSQCRPGAPCFALDTAPCPARQGDPCAPKPPCVGPHTIENDELKRDCYRVDEPLLRNPAEWTEWGPCSTTCGPAIRSRQCSSGLNCFGPSSQPCSLPPCQEWTQWTAWTSCSVSCGNGERSRSRTCRGGRECEGPSVMVESCSTALCPTWAPWGEWQGCTIACGQGRERRNRVCVNGLFCPGQPVEERICDRGPCPHWSDWTQWSDCTSTCGGGEMSRRRQCEDGSTCAGASEERLLCNQQPCPTWTPWTGWSVCEDKCGEESFRLRNRICLYRGVAYAGCEGPAQDQLPCPVRECASWSDWGDWSDCSATCGQGNQLRNRKCEGGTDCAGSPTELRFCQLASCPYWGEWSDWGGCSVSCGMGVCERKRKCVTDEILSLPTDLSEFDESPAEEDSDKAKAALIARSKHIKMMRNVTEIRMSPSRTLTDAGSCDGPDVDRKSCDAGPCCGWETWSEWSPCIGCGQTAMVRRSRQCAAEGAGMPPLTFQEDHQPRRIPQTYAMPDFSGLQPIVPIIHRGKRHSAFQFEANQCRCPGPSMETQPCPAAPACDEPKPSCEWSSWGEWCGCAPCRAGRENRKRFCDRGGRPDPECRCSGSDIEERTCPMAESCFRPKELEVQVSASNDQYIPIDSKIGSVQIGQRSYVTRDTKKDSALKSSPTTPFPYPVCRWSRWSEWSDCHENRLKQRNRFCIGSDGLVNNCQCMGGSTEDQDCDPENKERERPANAVPGDEETSSQLEFNSEGEDLEQGVASALKSTDEDFSMDATNQAEEKKDDCQWTRWSMWSDCTASCGQGERYRKRRCPCEEGRCGDGVDSQTNTCQRANCLERRSHPVFNITT